MDLLFDVRPDENTEEFIKNWDGRSVDDDTLFFKDHVNKSMPLVLKAGCAEVSSKWTNEYLIRTTQDGLEVDVDIAPPSSC